MAEQEIYRLEVNVDITGDERTRRRLSAMDRYTERSERRMRQLDRMEASPAVRLEDRLSSPLNKVESRIGAFAKRAVKKFAAVAAAGGILIGGLGLGSTMQTFMDFEQGMKNVQATTMATEEEMVQLTDTAKKLGSTTAFTAKEASDGMNYLAMAGFKTNEIIEAMPGLLDLAAASGSDLARTSDIVSDALTAFGMSAQETTHLADVMAKASSTANTNVELLGESFKYAAAPATAFGMSAEETTAALAAMADAGIKGSMAGSSLRGALTRLAKPPRMAAKWIDKLGISIADAEGNIRPFNDIMGDMRGSMKNLTQEQRQQAIASIFGQEAMSGMLAVLNTSTEDFDAYVESLKNADGAAKEMASIKLDSLSGQFTILKSAVEGAKIELGERLAPYAKDFVTWMTDNMPAITDKIVEMVDKTVEFGTKAYPYVLKFVDLLKDISPLIAGIAAGFVAFKAGLIVLSIIDAFIRFKAVLGTVVFAFQAVAGGAATLAEGMALIMGPVGWIALAIGALVTVGILLWKNWDTIKEKAGQLADWIGEKWNSIKEWTSNAWDNVKSTVSDKWNSLKETISNTGSNIKQGVLNTWDNIKTGTANKWDSIKSTVSDGINKAKEIVSNVIANLPSHTIESFTRMKDGIFTAFEGIKNIFSGYWNIIKNIFLGALLVIIDLVTLDFESLKTDIAAIWENIKAGLSQVWEGIKQVFSGAGEYIKGYLTLLWESLKNGIQIAWTSIINFFVSTWETIKTGAVEGWNSFKEGVANVITGSIEWIKGTWNSTVEWFSTLPSRLYEKGIEMFNSLKDGLASMKETVASKAKEVGTGIVEKVKSLPGEMLDIGKDIMQGLADGIKSMITAPIEAAKDVAAGIAEKIRSKLKIHSPSRLMMEYGGFTTEGLAKGIKNKIPKLETVVGTTYKVITDKGENKKNLLKNFFDMTIPKAEKLKEVPFFQKVVEKTKKIKPYIMKSDSDEPQDNIPVVAAAGSGGGNTYIIKIDNIDVNIDGPESNGDSDEDIREIVQEAQEEFGRKLLEALRDKK